MKRKKKIIIKPRGRFGGGKRRKKNRQFEENEKILTWNDESFVGAASVHVTHVSREGLSRREKSRRINLWSGKLHSFSGRAEPVGKVEEGVRERSLATRNSLVYLGDGRLRLFHWWHWCNIFSRAHTPVLCHDGTRDYILYYTRTGAREWRVCEGYFELATLFGAAFIERGIRASARGLWALGATVLNFVAAKLFFRMNLNSRILFTFCRIKVYCVIKSYTKLK